MNDISASWKDLKPEIGNFIGKLNSEAGRLEKLKSNEATIDQKVKEAYQKGVEDTENKKYRTGIEDMLEAIRLLEKPIENGGIPCKDMRRIFGSVNSSYIISNKSAEEIINGVIQWEKEKMDEISFEVGDEVEFWDTNCELFKKYVIIRADPSSTVIWLLNLKTFCRIWFDKDKIADLKKTGRHFDTIDIPKEGIAV